MKNDDKVSAIEIKLKNLTFIVIIGYIIIGLLVIGLYFTNKDISKTTSETNGGNNTKVAYDVSKMKEVTGSEAAKLFDLKGTHFLYIGRSTCSVCVSLVPELNKTISSLNITLNYLPLGSDFRTEFADLFDHLDIETTINKEKGTYGSLLKENGYTPLVIVIKDGKMVDGFVGRRDSSKINELFKKYM